MSRSQFCSCRDRRVGAPGWLYRLRRWWTSMPWWNAGGRARVAHAQMWGAPRLSPRPWKALDQASGADVVFIATTAIRTAEVIDASWRDCSFFMGTRPKKRTTSSRYATNQTSPWCDSHTSLPILMNGHNTYYVTTRLVSAFKVSS